MTARVLNWTWASSERMTVLVGSTRDGVVVVAPPIVRGFVGKPVDALMDWMRRQPGFRSVELQSTLRAPVACEETKQ